MTPEKRYIAEAEIEHFKQRLRSGLLDAVQARAAAVRLAEAREELDEHDWGSIRGLVTVAISPNQLQPSEHHPGLVASRTHRAPWSAWFSWLADPGT
jgi:hypothetical protein